MNDNSFTKVLVLYKITNVKGESVAYNAFELSGKGSVSLRDVKNNCHALQQLNPAGANGYHWRVRVDDKVTNPKAPPKYSWWDIQDENARLPVKEVSFTDLSHILSPSSHARDVSHHHDSSSSSMTASSVTRSLGKALKGVAASVDVATSSTPAHHANFPRVPIVMFKLLDVTKLYDEHRPIARSVPRGNGVAQARGSVSASASRNPSSSMSHSQGQRQGLNQGTSKSTSSRVAQPSRAVQQKKVEEGTLMDFGAPAPSVPISQPQRSRVLQHAHTSPPAVSSSESRAEKLKREYEEKKRTENRVWDEVDQRWVTVDSTKDAVSNRSTPSAPPGANVAMNKTKIQAVSLDNVNTAGKSAAVANAVQNRVNEMRESQEKALKEIRDREAAKAKTEAEEDVVRQKLEPKIKAWAEEHGKKKQLRALLASLDKVLWPGANWKPIGLGDLLDDKKVKIAYHKASRVVHPDKTISLGPEERFMAKRIFDSLAQAKSEWDSSK